MQLERSNRFKRDYRKAPLEIKKQANKALEFLMSNPKHPSLHTKKFDEKRNIWQARVTGSWRIHFQIHSDVIYLIQLYNPKN